MLSNRTWLKGEVVIWLLITIALWLFFFNFHIPLDYENCPKCDRHEYKKLYDYFEYGSVEQIKFPYFIRPAVPFLAAMLPAADMAFSFHLVNLIFALLSVFFIWKLWRYLNFPPVLLTLGFAWLLLHWSGIIRYNLMDFITVDVPVYFFEALVLWLFFKKKLKWFFLLTPLTLLVKESFTPVMMVLIAIQIFQNRKVGGFHSAKPLIFSLIIGIMVQKAYLWWMPTQLDSPTSVMTLFWHLRWAVEDPTRLIRWFAAFGCAYGVLPVAMVLRLRWNDFKNEVQLTLCLLTLVFMFLGLSAGSDMTRIMFLGFPFMMTCFLVFLNEERWPVILGTTLLSIPFMRLYPFCVHSKWSVDYAPNAYVYEWAGYYILSIALMIIVIKVSDTRAQPKTG